MKHLKTSRLLLMLALLLCSLCCYAQAESEMPVIYLNGKPVTEAVMNLSVDNQLQFTSNQEVTWKSSKAYRGEIDQTGLLTGKSSSTIWISATNAEGKKARCEVKLVRLVTNLTITGSTELAGGRKTKLNVSALPGNASNKKVTWSSSDTSVATVNSSGRVTAKKISEVKSVVIRATARDGSGVYAEHTITVKPSAERVSIVKNGETAKEFFIDITSNPTLQLGALVYPEAASQHVTWSTSNKRTATVTESGLVTGLRTGSVTITAKTQDGTGRKTTVKVRVVRMTTGIQITGATSVLAGKRVQLSAVVEPKNATEKGVTWSSSDPTVVSVDKRGRATAQKVSGLKSAVITATAKDGSGIAAQHTIFVTPAISKMQFTVNNQSVSGTQVIDLTSNPTLDLGMFIEPSDACQEVKWSTSSSKRATVDANGVVTAKRTGSVTITATAQDGSKKKTSIKISIIRAVKSIEVTGDTALAGGKSGRLYANVLPSNATNKKVTWESSDPSVVTVDSRGRIKAKQSDTVKQATIYAKAKDGSGVVGSTVVTVTPRATSVSVMKDGQAITALTIDVSGQKQVQLSAAVYPAAAHQEVTWSTSNKRRATVDQNGVVTGIADGQVTITATAKDGTGVRARITVNVGTSVKQIIINGPTDVSASSEIELEAQVLPRSATNRKITWSSSNPSIARINKYGDVKASLVDAPTPVTFYATAADGSGTVGEFTVMVRPIASSLSIYREDAGMATTLIIDENQGKANLGVTVTPSTASQNVRWSSSNDWVATVDSNGVVTGHNEGQTVITATARDGSGVKARLTVGVGDTAKLPYYIEVDYANHVVRVYERGEDGSYSHLYKRMIASMGLKPSYGLEFGLYQMNGQHMEWMDGIVMYATRIEGQVLFHSVKYYRADQRQINVEEYAKLGSPASAGCFRLLTGDAKWIYDNVPKDTFVRWMRGVRDINEYGSVSAPELTGSGWDPTNPNPNNPDFDPTYTSDVKK